MKSFNSTDSLIKLIQQWNKSFPKDVNLSSLSPLKTNGIQQKIKKLVAKKDKYKT